ncbi:MAG TPA: FkbM family methyltransferase [Acetobacteraceae bacterium]|nr:FkbM family methyltransferase [Acetobacteraceae bacterium]
MQKNVFECFGRRIELWTHPEPDHLARVIRSQRTFYEIDLLMKCREIYLPNTRIIDVGANIGNHSVFFSAILNAPVYAFEPFPPNYALLELNIAANGLDDRIVASCCAVGEAVGMATLQPGPPANFGTTRVVAGAGETLVRSLDSLDIPGPISLIKVDVEGEELPVLRGAEALIQAWLPDLVIEAGTPQAFRCLADAMLRFGYVPRGRFAATPTWLFSAADQISRMRHVLTAI